MVLSPSYSLIEDVPYRAKLSERQDIMCSHPPIRFHQESERLMNSGKNPPSRRAFHTVTMQCFFHKTSDRLTAETCPGCLKLVILAFGSNNTSLVEYMTSKQFTT